MVLAKLILAKMVLAEAAAVDGDVPAGRAAVRVVRVRPQLALAPAPEGSSEQLRPSAQLL